ncbi:hypothetical protein [Blastococcus sp. Marseille-P5729]|uniref:hypothetical protein n=1 Tax=Blastococcus sp. Marseille-P5729 TaxID=2086582 RepID=UPI00131CF122|nr:hypothetical protein [Blastococcus sp. Marseille-P5729]
MRRPVRADLVVWLALLLTAVLIVTSLQPVELSIQALGLHGAVRPDLTPALPAAMTAMLVLGLASRLVELPWPVFQLVSFLGAASWGACLAAIRQPVYDGGEVGTFLGNALSRWLAYLAEQAAWAPSILVGVGAGAAVILLNAAVQSLSGGVQARRLAPALILSPGAAVLADGVQVGTLVAMCGVLAVSAMSSERGRGLLWSTGFALLSGILLFGGALTGFACTAAGVGMLSIYFLRRRSLMIVVAAAGLLASLLAAAALGWSWPEHFGEASALTLADPAGLAASVVVAAVLVAATGGPTHRESWRKLRGTPAWPVMLSGLVAAFIAVLTRPATLGVVPAAAVWLPLLTVAASAPPRAAGTPEGPALLGVSVSAGCGLAMASLGILWSELG